MDVFPWKREGSALVEYTFILLTFTVMTLAIVDLGRGILYYNMLSNAVREGARLGIIASKTSDEICALVYQRVQFPGVAAQATCPASPANGFFVSVPNRGSSGGASDPIVVDPVIVSASYDFELVTPIIGSIVGNPVTLQARSSMYVE